MKGVSFLAAALTLIAAFPSISEAGGFRSRQVIRQRIVQPVYAAPVVQSIVVPQAVYAAPVYSAPLIQSYSSGCGVSQQLRLRSSVGGCGAFFGH